MSKRTSRPTARPFVKAASSAAPSSDAAVAEARAGEAAPAHADAGAMAMRVSRDASLTPFDILDDYERRSLAHVVGLPEQLDAPGLWRGVGYRIGSKRLASGFDEVVEIMPMPQVTPVPGAQPWLLGVANIRGNLNARSCTRASAC
jgi:hypothetical protein